jgi:hypothetical protein
MINGDTVKLLNECNAGIKMAVSSFNEILPNVKNEQLRQSILTCKMEHERLGDETHKILNSNQDGTKQPNPIAQGMSWVKTGVKMKTNPTDSTVADLITDGCNMGVKSLYRYLNKYKEANSQAKDITNQIIRSEENLLVNTRAFL